MYFFRVHSTYRVNYSFIMPKIETKGLGIFVNILLGGGGEEGKSVLERVP